MARETKKALEAEFVGKRVKYEYGAPALSCFMNGKRIRGEGVVTHIERHSDFGWAICADGTCLRRSEIVEVVARKLPNK